MKLEGFGVPLPLETHQARGHGYLQPAEGIEEEGGHLASRTLRGSELGYIAGMCVWGFSVCLCVAMGVCVGLELWDGRSPYLAGIM